MAAAAGAGRRYRCRWLPMLCHPSLDHRSAKDLLIASINSAAASINSAAAVACFECYRLGEAAAARIHTRQLIIISIKKEVKIGKKLRRKLAMTTLSAEDRDADAPAGKGAEEDGDLHSWLHQLSVTLAPDALVVECVDDVIPSTWPSSTWRALLAGIPIIQAGTCWRVGNGRLINFWLDTWTPYGPLKHCARRLIAWQPPDLDQLKLNVDAGRRFDGMVTIAGLIRDYTGAWIMGFHQKLQPMSITEAELQSIKIIFSSSGKLTRHIHHLYWIVKLCCGITPSSRSNM